MHFNNFKQYKSAKDRTHIVSNAWVNFIREQALLVLHHHKKSGYSSVCTCVCVCVCVYVCVCARMYRILLVNSHGYYNFRLGKPCGYYPRAATMGFCVVAAYGVYTDLQVIMTDLV